MLGACAHRGPMIPGKTLLGAGDGLLDRALCVAGTVLFSQIPEFMQQYLQRLGGQFVHPLHGFGHDSAEFGHGRIGIGGGLADQHRDARFA